MVLLQLVMMLVLKVMTLVQSAALQFMDACLSGLVSVVYLRYTTCRFEKSSNNNSGIGLGIAVNIAILVMGWRFAFGEFKAYLILIDWLDG